MSSQKNKFNDFVKFYDKDYYSSPLMNNKSKGNWNPKRQDYLKQYNTNRKSFLSELEEIEATSVSDLIPKEFFSEKNTKNIFNNFLKELSLQEAFNHKRQILSIDSCPLIAEQKEEYEIVKRNLMKYIDYIMYKNFNLLKNNTKNINTFYIRIEKSLLKIAVLKKKFGFIKNKYLLVNSEIYLKKQKLKNCQNIYNNLLKIKEFKSMYLSLTNNKKSNNLIENNSKSKFNKTEELINKIENFKYYNKSLICFWFIQHLRINKNDYIDNYEESLSKLFLTKISIEEFSSLYDIFSSLNGKKNCKDINDELISKITISLKKNILNVFKGILLSYATIDYGESLNSNTILKLKQLQLLSFEEDKLFMAINQICLTILKLCDNLYCYIFNKDYRNTKLGQLFYINRKIFYEILNKKIRKILALYTDLIINFQDKKNIFLTLSSFSLIYAYIEKTFQIENSTSNNSNIVKKNLNNNSIVKSITLNRNNKIISKTIVNANNINNNLNNSSNNSNTNQISVLKKEIYNFFYNYTSYEVKQDIKNLALYLNKDIWKKINLLNLNEQLNKKNIKIIKYRDFLYLPFTNNSIDKNEIKNKLTNLSSFHESKDIKLNINKMLNKKLNERNLVFSSSSFNLLYYIFELISYYLIIPNMKKKIINDIFNLYDYYLYSSILMFNYDKTNNEKLRQKSISKESKNINQISYNELLSISKDIEFYQNYMDLIPFMWHCKKEVLVKVLGNEKMLFTILPSLSPTIISNNNSQDNSNNANTGNFIEKIICYESYWTIYKIIKRIIPKGKGNEIYLTQMNKYKIILMEIRHLIYYPLSLYMIKNKSYINNFINTNWIINSNNINKDKVNVYIKIMIDNLNDVNNKLNMFLNLSLKSKIRFVYFILYFMINNIKASFHKIKNINQQGLNVMINDFKAFRNKIYEFINCNNNGNENNNKLKNIIFDDIFNNMFEYLNNIVNNKDIFLNNVLKNKIPLYLINDAINLNKSISNEDKKKILSDLKCIYIKEMQIIDKLLIKFN